jgi:hypothetical protein
MPAGYRPSSALFDEVFPNSIRQGEGAAAGDLHASTPPLVAVTAVTYVTYVTYVPRRLRPAGSRLHACESHHPHPSEPFFVAWSPSALGGNRQNTRKTVGVAPSIQYGAVRVPFEGRERVVVEEKGAQIFNKPPYASICERQNGALLNRFFSGSPRGRFELA